MARSSALLAFGPPPHDFDCSVAAWRDAGGRDQGWIVLVGPTEAGLGDIRLPRLSGGARRRNPRRDRRTLLSGALLTRPDWSPGAELAGAVLLTLLMAFALPALSPIAGGQRRR